MKYTGHAELLAHSKTEAFQKLEQELKNQDFFDIRFCIDSVQLLNTMPDEKAMGDIFHLKFYAQREAAPVSGYGYSYQIIPT